MIYSKKSHIGRLGRHNISISAAATELLRQTKENGAACGKERKNATRLFLPVLVPLEDVPAKQIGLRLSKVPDSSGYDKIGKDN
ncbi:hypothetical protein Ddc_12711 [Ditylenchus destructor]|nr:hypothetical protein Ddc_12711 [Ditylenchus destructor]